MKVKYYGVDIVYINEDMNICIIVKKGYLIKAIQAPVYNEKLECWYFETIDGRNIYLNKNQIISISWESVLDIDPEEKKSLKKG